MRTAEEYYTKYCRSQEGNKSDFIKFLNEARKEAITECAERVQITKATKLNDGTWEVGVKRIDKQSILSLIDELK